MKLKKKKRYIQFFLGYSSRFIPNQKEMHQTIKLYCDWKGKSAFAEW